MIFILEVKLKIFALHENLLTLFLLKSLKDMAEQEKVRNIDFHFSKYNFYKIDKLLIINNKNAIKQIK